MVRVSTPTKWIVSSSFGVFTLSISGFSHHPPLTLPVFFNFLVCNLATLSDKIQNYQNIKKPETSCAPCTMNKRTCNSKSSIMQRDILNKYNRGKMASSHTFFSPFWFSKLRVYVYHR